MATGAIKVRGAPELERAFMQLRREVFLEMKAALIEAGEDVRVEAESRAHAHVHVDESGRDIRIGPKWERMRLGATVKGVYVAPFSKRRGGSPRPNLAPLLLDFMEGALDAKGEEVLQKFEILVTASAARQGFIVI